MTSLIHNHGPIPSKDAPCYPRCPACQARRFNLVTRLSSAVMGGNSGYFHFLTCIVEDKRMGQSETRNIEIQKLADRRWNVEVSRVNGGAVTAFCSSSRAACTLAFRGCGDSKEDAQLLVDQIAHLLPEDVGPAKPFPWFTLCVFAPILATAVVATLWVILKSF